MALLMTMVTAQGPVDNVLGTDLETSRVLVVEHQRQQYVPSLHVHGFDDNHDYNVFSAPSPSFKPRSHLQSVFKDKVDGGSSESLMDRPYEVVGEIAPENQHLTTE